DHAGPEHGARVGGAVVGYLRVLVHLAADAVADVFADDGKALPFDPGLDGGADLADTGAATGGGNSPPERLAGNLDQLLGLGGQRSGADRHSHVGDETLASAPNVDAYDVAFRYFPVAGDAMHDLVVHGHADRGRIRRLPVVEERGNDAPFLELSARNLVKLPLNHSRTHMAHDDFESLRQDASGFPHKSDFIAGLDDYRHQCSPSRQARTARVTSSTSPSPGASQSFPCAR